MEQQTVCCVGQNLLVTGKLKQWHSFIFACGMDNLIALLDDIPHVSSGAFRAALIGSRKWDS